MANIISRRQFLQTTAAVGAMSAVAVGTAISANAAEAEDYACTQTAIMEVMDWGASVTGTILTLKHLVCPNSVSADCFETVTEIREIPDTANPGGSNLRSATQRMVLDAYTCDKNGKRTQIPSNRIRLDIAFEARTAAPCFFDRRTWLSDWCPSYELEISLKRGCALTCLLGEKLTAVSPNPVVDYDTALIPQINSFVLDERYTGSDGRTLSYAYYAPKGRNKKIPLVIWLHGAGEGGTDTRIPLIGCKSCVLADDEFQNAMGGAAYVLAPQANGFWLQYNDTDSWMGNPGVPSIYTNTLKELIDSFVAAHPDIDTDRIIIGGCSNGGYMTVNMVLQYPDYFAAAYPICEAYKDSGITDEQLAAIKDIPMWFVYAQNDPTVVPEQNEIPTIARLRALNANIHTSVYADVHDTTGRYKGADGAPYQYSGHWSWVYFLNNECTDDTTGENLWNWLGDQSK